MPVSAAAQARIQITVADGLPQGFVSGLIQDNQGFIWISTRNGLARYDGFHFKVFQHNNHDTASLTSNVVSTIYYEAKKDRIWIFYENRGIDYMSATTEQIVHYSTQFPAAINEKPYQTVVAENKEGIIIKAPTGFLVCRDTAVIDPFHTEIPAKDSILHFATNQGGVLYVLTQKNLFIYDSTGMLLKKTTFPFFSDWNPLAYKIFCSPEHHVLVSSPDGIREFYREQDSFSIPNKAPREITRSYLIRDSLLYLHAGKALYSFSIRSKTYRLLIDTLPDMNTILADNTGVVWLGTNGKGLEKAELYPTTFRFQKVTRPFAQQVLTDLLHIPEKDIPRKLTINNRFTSSFRWAYDHSGALWLTNTNIYEHTPQFTIFRWKDNRLEETAWKIVDAPEKFKPLGVYGIAEDSKNVMWLINTNLFLFRLAPRTHTAKVFKPSLSVHMQLGEHNLYIDDEDNFWIPSEYGLLQYREGWTQYKLYLFNNEDKKDITNNRFMSVEQDRHNNNVLWLGSGSNGLIRFDKTTHIFTSFTKDDGLPDNTVYSALSDEQGYLWCTTNSGLFRFNPADSSVRPYVSQEGIASVEFNKHSYLRMPDNALVFGGFEYYTCFHPQKLREDTYSPKVAITGFLVNNKLRNIFTSPGYTAETSAHPATLQLRYNENFIDVHFAAMQYNHPELIKYRYRLSGINSDWVYADKGDAGYTNLPDGNYTLDLNATNTAGMWSSNIKSIHIRIMPPWWGAWWAYLLYLSMAVSIVLFVIRNRMKQVKLQQEIYLKERETGQLKAMDELKGRLFANITHEFRTPLSLIIAPLEEERKHNPTLNKAYQNAMHLLRLINQLLDMNKMDAGSLNITLSRGYFCRYTASLCTAFEAPAAAKNITFRFKGYPEEKEHIFDADKWEKIVYNLLSNALKFTPGNGAIQVGLQMTESEKGYDLFTFTVTDTGIGIGEAHLPYIFDRFYQADDSSTRKYEGAGIGLSFVKELVTLMGGKIKAESTIGEGSTFTLSFRLDAATSEHDYEALPTRHETTIPEEEPEQSKKDDTPTHTKDTPVILVAEDNSDLCNFIKSCLEPYYKVLTANNGKTAWSLAQDELPEIIISDVMMPEADGLEFCRNIKSHITTNHIAFIFLTAKTAHENKITGLHTGADDYITKPFHVDELLLRISNIINRQRTLKEYYTAHLRPEAELMAISKVEDPFLQSVYRAIDQYLDDKQFDVEALAAAVFVSRRTLNRKLAAVINLSASEIIRTYRLKRAAAILTEGHPIATVAYMTGFDTPSYFSKCFKDLFHCTPKVYISNLNALKHKKSGEAGNTDLPQ